MIGTGGQNLQEVYAATTLSGILHVIVHKINRDSKLVVNVSLGQEGSVSDLRLRNSKREVYVLEPGYNTIDFDPTWDSPFEISPINVIMESDADNGRYKEDFSVYLNYSAVGFNSDNFAYTGIMPVDDSVLYVFVKRPPLAAHFINFTIGEGLEAPEVTYDLVKTVVPSADNDYRIKIFSGTEVSVKLAAGTTIEGYEKNIVDGMLMLNPTSNLTLNVIQVVEESIEITWDFTPAEQINNHADDMDPIAVVFSAEFDVTLGDASKIKLTLNGEELSTDDYTAICDGHCFMLQVSNPTYFNIEGILALDIALGGLLVGGVECPAISHSWTVVKEKVSVLSVNPNDPNLKANVVAIYGRVVLTNAGSAQIKSLTPGIYIINGKKILYK